MMQETANLVGIYSQLLGPSPTEAERVLWDLQYYIQKEDVKRNDLLYFIDEFTKLVLNWIGKGEEDALKSFAGKVERIIRSNPEWDEPLAGLSKSQKFGANLVFLQELIYTYLNNHLALKDYQHIMIGGKVAERLRRVLNFFFENPRRLNYHDLYRIYAEYDGGEQLGMGEDVRKLMQRDMEKLADYKLIRKIALGPKKSVFEATPRAYALQNELQRLQYKEEEPSLVNYSLAQIQIASTAPMTGPMAYSPKYTMETITT